MEILSTKMGVVMSCGSLYGHIYCLLVSIFAKPNASIEICCITGPLFNLLVSCPFYWLFYKTAIAFITKSRDFVLCFSDIIGVLSLFVLGRVNTEEKA